MTHPVKAAVFGTGSWGTAFAMVLADAGCDVTLWARRAEVAEAVNTTRTNPDYLPGIELPASVRATTDAAEALRGADFAVLVVPSQTLRANLADWAPHLEPQTVLVSLMKGVELGTAKRMSEVIEDVTQVSADRIAVVSGPNLAKEIAERRPAAAVVACQDESVARRLQAACHTPYFRPYTSTDVVGCELGGAVKNVIGLAVGIADGMGLGDNTKGSLITRGLAETIRLGVAMGADPLTFSGLMRPRRPGGDLLLAALAQPHLRNQPRPRHDAPGDHRRHQADRRGRQVVRVRARPGPTARSRDASHRDGRRHRPRGQAAHGRGQGTHVAQRQGRTALRS